MEAAPSLLSELFTERVLIAILLVGIVLMGIGYVWLTFRAVIANRWWRIGYLPPLSLFYLLSFSRRVVGPLVLLLIGGTLTAMPYVLTHYVQPLLPLHPWEKLVDGELHVTLTGLDAFNYSTLKNKKTIAVLQMANKDVTDATLENLKGHDLLYELDLNDTQITDAGLGVLNSLPKLKKLRIARTKITDDGFTKFLGECPSLTHLDATGTEIKTGTLRSWKKAKDEREYLK